MFTSFRVLRLNTTLLNFEPFKTFKIVEILAKILEEKNKSYKICLGFLELGMKR